MLATQEKREVLAGGFTDVRKFTFQNSAKMFKITVSGLYSDKVKAVVREYLANAYDAHLQAGNQDQPFEVHLPTQFEPWFSVRDFGCSMTHEGVMNNFSCVGWSSKDGSSTEVSQDMASRQTGKWGLGCKVAYAYSDTFSVSAFLNGEKRDYNAFQDEDGTPVIAHAMTQGTDQPNGVEIVVPVKISDIDNFRRAATEVLRGYDVQPILSGGKPNVEERKVIVEGSFWKLFEAGYNRASFTAQARQGVVVYPIDRHAIPNLTRLQMALLDEPLFIEFPVGEVDITPSRESLSYDPVTIENIQKRLDLIESEIRAKIEAQIADAPNMFTARNKLRKLRQDSVLRYNVRDALTKNLKWRGRDVDTGNISLPVGTTFLHTASGNLLKRKNLPKMVTSTRYGGNVGVTENTLVVLYPQDAPIRAPFLRLQRLLTQRYHNGAANSENTVLLIQVPAINSMAARRIIAKLGRPPFISLADLELPVIDRTPRRRVKNAPFSARGFAPGASDASKGLDFEITPEDGGYYVQGVGREVEVTDTSPETVRCDSVANMVTRMRGLGMIPAHVNVVIMPQQRRAIPLRNKGWINVMEVARAASQQEIDASTKTKADALRTALNNTRYRAIRGAVRSSTVDLGSDHLVIRMIEEIEAVANMGGDPANVEARVQIGRVCGVEPKVINDGAVKTLFDDVLATYPMLTMMEEYSYRYGMSAADQKKVVDYIKLVDERNSI